MSNISEPMAYVCSGTNCAETFTDTVLDNVTHNDELILFFETIRERTQFELYTYTLLFVIGIFSNTYVLIHFVRDRNLSPSSYLIKHLTIADLMVIFVTITIEIVWRLSVSWPTGVVGCKLAQVRKNLIQLFVNFSLS